MRITILSIAITIVFFDIVAAILIVKYGHYQHF